MIQDTLGNRGYMIEEGSSGRYLLYRLGKVKKFAGFIRILPPTLCETIQEAIQEGEKYLTSAGDRL